ncbi:MAG: hypothetical protein U0522_02595 [Candidatus Paceibacterota bacterium]
MVQEKKGFSELVKLSFELCEYCAEVARTHKQSNGAYAGLSSWSKEELKARQEIRNKIDFCLQAHDLTDADTQRALDIAVEMQTRANSEQETSTNGNGNQ